MQQTRSENRFLYMLKGIACILVVFIHFPLTGRLAYVLSTLCRCAVPMFFVIAGRYMYGASGTTYSRLLRRLGRLAFTTMGVLAVYTLYSFVFHRTQGMSAAQWIQMKYLPIEWLRLAAVNASMIIWDSSYVFDFLWYLFAMLWVQLFMIVALRWRKEWKQAVCIGLMSMLYVCQYMGFSATVPVLRIFSGSTLFFRNWLFVGLPFALAGVWIASANVPKNSSPLVWWVVALCGLLLALREEKHFETAVLPVGAAMLTLSLAVLAEFYPQKGSRMLAFVGKNLSASVYYWHVLIGTLLKRVCEDGPSNGFSLLVAAVAVAFSLGLYGLKTWIRFKKA